MNNLKRYTCRSVWILAFLFSSTLLWAQNEPYHGDSASGFAFVKTNLLSNCNAFRFNGDSADGFAIVKTSLLGNCNAFRFQGDSADGYATAKSNLVNCPVMFFTGDSAGGFATGKTALLNCNTFRFLGDTADGFATTNTSLLNCNTFRYAGDSSDGFSAVNTNLLNCNTFRFQGDSSDGAASAVFLQIRNFMGNDTSVYIICSSNTYDLLTLYNISGITNIWQTPTPSSVGLGNYTVVGTNQSGCKDSAIAVVTQEVAKWTGMVSTDWHDAANWNTLKVPDESTHVIIPGGTPNPCVISNAFAKAASVQGKTAGSLSVINNQKLVITANCGSLPPGL